jgi:L-ribulose-5-phosphate 4-epimerase
VTENQNQNPTCSLCGKGEGSVETLVVGLRGAICDQCGKLVADILATGNFADRARAQISSSSLAEEVCHINQMLPRTGLVTMHSGNCSALDPDDGIVYIKPSGFDYDKLTPDKIVKVDLKTGKVIDSDLRPSVDLPHHLFLYKNMPEVRSVIHTHSNHATAFAAAGKSIPLVLTAIADEFGCDVPCAPYVDNEGEHIGETILKFKNRAPAILMGNHGVFAWGPSPSSALKAAVMVEDVAKTVLLSMMLGTPAPIPPEEAEKWYDRYHNRYGQ